MRLGPSFQTSQTPLPLIRTLIIGYHRLNFLCSSNASSCIWNLVTFWKYDGDLFIKQSPLKFRHLKPKANSFDVRKPDETPTIIDKRNPILYPNKNLDLSQTTQTSYMKLQKRNCCDTILLRIRSRVKNHQDQPVWVSGVCSVQECFNTHHSHQLICTKSLTLKFCWG